MLTLIAGTLSVEPTKCLVKADHLEIILIVAFDSRRLFYAVSDAEQFTKNYNKCYSVKMPEDAITIDDVNLAHQNQPYQHYHAFVLYSENDINFAKEIIRNVEKPGLKV